MTRSHENMLKKFVCTEPLDGVVYEEFEPKIPLAKCRYCSIHKKTYGMYYNAEAHLRRAHFRPRVRGRRGTIRLGSHLEKRGCDLPPMSELKRWMKVVWIEDKEYESQSRSPTASPKIRPQSNTAQAAFSIFVGNLSPEVNEHVLLSFFRSRYRSCKSAKVMTKVHGLSRRYGFVRFSDEDDQQRALNEMQSIYCGSRPMRISKATLKNDPGDGGPDNTLGGMPGAMAKDMSPKMHSVGSLDVSADMGMDFTSSILGTGDVFQDPDFKPFVW